MMEESFFFYLNIKFIDIVFFEKCVDLEKERKGCYLLNLKKVC